MTLNLLQSPTPHDPSSADAVRLLDVPTADDVRRSSWNPRGRASDLAAGRAATVTMVCFRVSGAAYGMPVELTRSVRLAVGMVPLPVPGRDIVGVVPGEPPLTVIAPLGPGGNQVLVVAAEGKTFGLLVDEVTRLLAVPVADVGAAPAGQHRALISGTVHAGGQLLMIADPMTMVELL